MRIYISGKMRGLSEEESRKKFNQAESFLRMIGHEVVNPWDSEDEKKKICEEWDDFILYDLQVLKECDGIYMLDNWNDSWGAKVEYAFAQGKGMKVFYEQ